MQSINTLYEFAIPTKGSFKDVIGQVTFGDYKTLVMTATCQTTIGKNVYSTIQGYILVKPLADQFKMTHPEAKMRRISDWNRKKQGSDRILHTETENSIAIEGSKEIQGTYFRPDIVLEVLEWVCPAFKTEINAVYEDYFRIQQENQRLNTTIKALEEFKKAVLATPDRIEHVQFGDLGVSVYGTQRDPLFLVNDIVCGLLESKNIGDNRFYRDYKDDSRYVTTCHFDMCPSDIQLRYKCNKPERIYFFTEVGLYKCLFRSNKPVADSFQEQVALLLRDIRMGVVTVERARHFETQQTLSATEERMQSAYDKINQMETELEQLKSRLNQDIIIRNTKVCYTYLINVVDRRTEEIIGQYAGSTQDINKRFAEHKKCSSNKRLRELITAAKTDNDLRVDYVEVERFNYCSLRGLKETALIQSIPIDKRLNVMTYALM